jgi:predicted enzyme related to lactoylglutathione lyase
MNQGIRTVIYPVKDLAQAKTLYSKLLGVEPIWDEAYYVGFKVGDKEIDLDPNSHNQGMTGPVGYYHVNDIKKNLQLLLDAGAQAQQEVKDVGGGKLIAS